MPQIDWLLRKNRVGDFFQRLFRTQPSLGILAFVAKAINEKREALAKSEKTVEVDDKYGRGKDFLTRYIELVQADPAIPPW